MSNKDTGGNAFPAPIEFSKELEKMLKQGLISEQQAHDSISGLMGLTVRDYFAAKAMQGYLACPGLTFTAKELVCASYDCADAMLEARK